MRYATAFVLIEYVSLLVFTVEYGLRLWCAIEHGPHQHLRHSRARMKYALSTAGIIDLIAVLPFWFAMLLPSDLRFVLVFRMVRFSRLRAIRPPCARCSMFCTASGADWSAVSSSRSALRWLPPL
jgi:voltage-gated potassium channel